MTPTERKLTLQLEAANRTIAFLWVALTVNVVLLLAYVALNPVFGK